MSALTDSAVARRTEPSVEPPQVTEELLIEEVSIDGMCGVY
ncbi:mycofactocin precursor MftA [Candidatus Contendibacter odensensis]